MSNMTSPTGHRPPRVFSPQAMPSKRWVNESLRGSLWSSLDGEDKTFPIISPDSGDLFSQDFKELKVIHFGKMAHFRVPWSKLCWQMTNCCHSRQALWSSAHPAEVQEATAKTVHSEICRWDGEPGTARDSSWQFVTARDSSWPWLALVIVDVGIECFQLLTKRILGNMFCFMSCSQIPCYQLPNIFCTLLEMCMCTSKRK